MHRKGLVAVLMVTTVALVSAAPPGEGPNIASIQEADLTGKILAVSTKGPVEGAVLQNARIKLLGRRAFLVGESLKAPDGVQRPEVTYWLPVEDILMIREYTSAEDVKKDYEASQKAKK
jgi:hypothetical protein